MKETDGRRNIEVEYKDFKTSELLEIRAKKHPQPSGEETAPAGGETESSRHHLKRSYTFVAFALLLCALIAGAYLIIRYLFLP